MDATPQIRNFIKETFVFESPAAFSDEFSLVESGVIDSLGILQVLLFLEKTFSLKVPEQDVVPDYFESVQAIASYVNGRLSGSGKA